MPAQSNLNPSDLTARPMKACIREIAVPASVGFFFSTMYNVVDTYFAGKLSTDALAALSLSLSVFFLIIALGSGLSTGTTALIGNALGAGKQEEAEMFAYQGISFGLAVSVLLTALGLGISPFLFSYLGAEGKYLAICLEYMNWIFAGSVFFIQVHMFNAILNALGNTKPFRNFLIAGFALNCLLDPWFIYGGFGLPAMGVAGVAVATVLIQALGVVYLAATVRGSGILCKQLLPCLRPRLRPYLEIARQGFPSALNMMTVGMGIFVITKFISLYGKDAVAAYGAAMRVEQMVLVPTIGLNISTLAIVARNTGARRFERIWEVIRHTLAIGAWIMGVGMVLVFVLAPWLMGHFTEDPAVAAIGAQYLRIDAFVFYAYVLLFSYVAALQGMKRPMFGVWMGLGRQIAAPVLVFWVLTRILEVGLVGIWWGIFGITWAAGLLVVFLAPRLMRSVMAGLERQDRETG